MFSNIGWRGTGNIISPRPRTSAAHKNQPPPLTVIRCCSGDDTNADLLKSQLQLLRQEAESTRSKAQNARLRLLRLSEAAEKLRRRAAIDVENGNEEEARDLLLQKKKVTRALDRSKNRIELLEQLSSKIDEAISLKESQLIGNLEQMDFTRDQGDQTVHIISPNSNSQKEKADANKSINVASLSSNEKIDNEKSPEERGLLREKINFDDLLLNVDQRLRNIESDLDFILKSPALLMENDEMERSLKVQLASTIYGDICGTRRRIAKIIQSKSDNFEPEQASQIESCNQMDDRQH